MPLQTSNSRIPEGATESADESAMRWNQLRLTWKNQDRSSWSSFDFRASFDGVKRGSLVDDSLNDLALNKQIHAGVKIEEEVNKSCAPPKQFKVELSKCSLGQLSSILSSFQREKVDLIELSAFPKEKEDDNGNDYGELSVIIRACCKQHLPSQVRTNPTAVVTEEIWFPRCIEDLNKCRSVLSSYEPDLDKDHPGFNDVAYRTRRSEIAKLAETFRHGEPIPRVDYTSLETKTWKEAYDNLSLLYETHACKEYLKYFKVLNADGMLSNDRIPQLQDLSDYLFRATGFQLCPVAGLVTARDFLACLAFRIFPCTQYVRHHDAPMHSPEPDLIHEVLGHVVMFMDPQLTEFSQKIGKASLGATDEEIVKLATLYWFTVEFGLLREEGELKAYGAGLLSSYGELEHALSSEPDHKEFDARITAVQQYDDYNYQTVYFVVDDFHSMMENFKSYLQRDASNTIVVLRNNSLDQGHDENGQ